MSVLPQTPPAVQQPAPKQGLASSVAGAIQRAAQATGASFEYLLATAKVESNFNPNLKADSSSATGLFQFIEQTWLGMVKNAGRAFGLGDYADAISRDASGRYEVSDPQLRNEILQLRRDPAANAAMAGAFTQSNAVTLSQLIGRQPTEGELYMAHFFGTGGAGQLINATKDRPQAVAATMFPAAARANQSIFYNRQSEPRSVAGVYAELNRRYQVARANVIPGVMPTAVASNTAAPDTDGTTRAFATADPQPVAEPVFRSLFHGGEGLRNADRGAVAPVVTELWGQGSPASTSNTAAAPTATAYIRDAVNQPQPLDLFREVRPNVRSLFTGGGGR